MSSIRNRRDIINRKALVIALEEIIVSKPQSDWQLAVVTLMKQTHQKGWEEVKRRFMEEDDNGRVAAHSLSFLMDQLLRTLFDFVTEHVYPLANPTASERLCLVATGGYGRGELAPYSDVDLLFLIPYKATPWAESVIEYMLYILWDMGLKVGHATRTPDECLRLAKEDLTIRTALLEARYLWGDDALFQDALQKFSKKLVSSSGTDFVEQKLAERDSRHQKLGDSRYVVEPNIKEGKGGLRDLQTMWWIAHYLNQDVKREHAVAQEVLTATESRQFKKAEKFLWTVRVALHYLANRPEERLTFDTQKQLANMLNYKDRPGASGVERFMKHYFLVAKEVGDLTRVFCAVLEARQKKNPFLAKFRRTKKLQEFALERGRLTFLNSEDVKKKPTLMIRIFRVADEKKLDIHPDAIRLIQHNLKRIGKRVQNDPEANADFMAILTSKNEGEINLRRMNEAGVFGKFVPDFGRVVAQMQYDMYHHYTVDEHTIRAIGLVARIEAGKLEKDHPLATRLIPNVISRNVLYVAVLLHDIAKGRGGDHSALGAEISKELGPRFGLKPAETEIVAWVVRWHLLMSNTAFKRDLTDPQTILDFCSLVKSPERLRLLLILTVVDIRAVGPGIWNGWKGQLLRELYYAAEEVLLAGHANLGRKDRVAAKKEELHKALPANWSEEQYKRHANRMNDAYWIAENTDTQVQNAQLMRKTDDAGQLLGVAAKIENFQDMTSVSVYSEDHPGLFARIVGALGVGGAAIMEAKIHTSNDGMAMDNFTVQDKDGKVFDSERQIAELENTILQTLMGNVKPKERLVERRIFGNKSEAFEVEPVVLIDNYASSKSTVIEVNAKDRPGLLYDLAYALYRLKLSILSAHVATYGERAIDVFYVQSLLGQKITNKVRLRNLEEKLLKAAVGDSIFNPQNYHEAAE